MLHPRDARRDALYEQAIQDYGAALGRLTRAYEADAEKRRDLLQDIHLAIWTSFDRYEQRCSLRTWVYRVAHNTATAHIFRQRRLTQTFIALETIEDSTPEGDVAQTAESRVDAARLLELVRNLRPDDRQILTLYMEGLESAEIGEITGISAGHVRTQIHRIKAVLSRKFRRGGKL